MTAAPAATALAHAPGIPHLLRAHLLGAFVRIQGLAAAQTAPRHWMLLFADLAEEAAVSFRLAEESDTAEAYTLFAEALREASQHLPAEAPQVAP